MRRQKRGLHALGEAEFLFEPRFVAGQFLVELRVLNGDRGLAGQQRQEFPRRVS
jgi:hypothetical protein